MRRGLIEVGCVSQNYPCEGPTDRSVLSLHVMQAGWLVSVELTRLGPLQPALTLEQQQLSSTLLHCSQPSSATLYCSYAFRTPQFNVCTFRRGCFSTPSWASVLAIRLERW